MDIIERPPAEDNPAPDASDPLSVQVGDLLEVVDPETYRALVRVACHAGFSGEPHLPDYEGRVA
jgi:hypothetical protein